MAAKTTHYRVGNGDMTLFEFESGATLLVDCNIRDAAEDPDDEPADVASQLRSRLKRDPHGRLYVDAFLLTHPDQDHCRGLQNHFHLGPPGDWKENDDKILIKEMWSSPIVFRRASKLHSLCDDAKAWNKEARRRVAYYRACHYAVDGERIKILGRDVDGKTDDLAGILVEVDTDFSAIAGSIDLTFTARLIAPLPADDDVEEDVLAKNDSSAILGISMKSNWVEGARYLIGGDAEVGVWERVWERNKERKYVLEYDVLVAPHHCSWHSLSWDSWSDCGEDADVSADARDALGQARPGARIVASSKRILDDDIDPPCIRAKREYEAIAKEAKGEFVCVSDGSGDAPLEFEIRRRVPQEGSRLHSWGNLGVRDFARRRPAIGPWLMDMGEISAGIARALRQMSAHPRVRSVRMSAPGVARIEVDSDLPSRWRALGESPNGVRAIEPMTIGFPDEFPASAPSFFLREDFDRSHPHLLPVHDGPPRPCLLNGSTNELMRSRGIWGLIDQLALWLERAARVQLIDPKQGWEPVRRDSIDDVVVTDSDLLREAVRREAGCEARWSTFCTFVVPDDGLRFHRVVVGNERAAISDEWVLRGGDCAYRRR